MIWIIPKTRSEGGEWHIAHCQSSVLVHCEELCSFWISKLHCLGFSSDLSLLFSTLEIFEEVHSFTSARAVDALPLKDLVPLRFYLPSFYFPLGSLALIAEQ